VNDARPLQYKAWPRPRDKMRHSATVAFRLLQATHILLLPQRIGHERTGRLGGTTMIVYRSFKRVRLLLHRYVVPGLCATAIALGGCALPSTTVPGS